MKRYRKGWRALPAVRAIGILSTVAIITSLVTFAAIQSTGNALKGNTIETATAALQISRDGTTFSDSMPGYDFNGIVPGGAAEPDAPGYLAVLKDTGSTNLNLSLSVPTPPVAAGITDLSTVSIIITPVANNGIAYASQTIKLSDLVAGKVAITPHVQIASGGTANFRLQVAMDANAVNGSGGSITGLDLSFSGTPY